jgi:hypothetical protein
MQKLKANVLMNLFLATFLTGVFAACATPSQDSSSKPVCQEQQAQVGSRLTRRTCKTQDEKSVNDAKSEVSAR